MRYLLAAGVLVGLAAAPAAAVTGFTYNFAGPASEALSSVTVTPTGAPSVTVVGRLYAVTPANLNNISQFSTDRDGKVVVPLISRFANTTGRTPLPGSIGIVGGANSQLDTNDARRREAFLLTATRPLSISRMTLSWTDENDTLKVYGVNKDGTLTTLAAGALQPGAGAIPGAAISNLGGYGNSSANRTTLDFATSLKGYDKFVFTTEKPGNPIGQGYRLVEFSASVVPEPETWAMMIVGFGLVGAAMRRRRPAVRTVMA